MVWGVRSGRGDETRTCFIMIEEGKWDRKRKRKRKRENEKKHEKEKGEEKIKKEKTKD